MGTDSIQLYNKKLSDQILGMNRSALTLFLESHFDVLKNIEETSAFSYCGLVSEMKEHKYSLVNAIKEILKETKLKDFKIRVAFDFCFSSEVTYLDYWGCYVHVFREGEPKGSIPSNKYLGEKEYDFLLLQPAHVDRMIKSLKEHADDLPVMKRMKTGIDRVEYFRDFCLGHPDYWVAYRYDF